MGRCEIYFRFEVEEMIEKGTAGARGMRKEKCR